MIELKEKKPEQEESPDRSILGWSNGVRHSACFIEDRFAEIPELIPELVVPDSTGCQACKLEPIFMGHQILGDSQLLRFSEQLLQIRRWKSNEDTRIGLCISGQRIHDLLRRIRKKAYQTSEKLIVMIGTNDILQSNESPENYSGLIRLKKCGFVAKRTDVPILINTSISMMKLRMKLLVLRLITNGATRIILMTLPPIPKLKDSEYHWETLKKFNKYVKSLHNGEDIFVIDAYAKFVAKSAATQPFSPCQRLNRIVDSTSSWASRAPLSAIAVADQGNDENGRRGPSRYSHHLNGPESKQNRFHAYDSAAVVDYSCDAESSYYAQSEPIDLYYFESHFEKSKKIDLVHLNNVGLEQIKKLIVNQDYIM